MNAKNRNIAYALEAYSNAIAAAEEEIANAQMALDELEEEWYDFSNKSPKILRTFAEKIEMLLAHARKAAERNWQRYR